MPDQASLGVNYSIWTNIQQALNTPATGVALPKRTASLVCKLSYPGSAPAAITLDVLGNNDNGSAWAVIGTFTELVNTVKRFDCKGYAFVSARITTHTTPQNNTLVVQPTLT